MADHARWRMRSTAQQADRAEGLLSRICTPVAKYWACKRAAAFVAEAMECHGGNGFIADHLMERLYREAPLNGIWEGSGNVICLDVLRAMQREPETRRGVARRDRARRAARTRASTGSSTTSSAASPTRPASSRSRAASSR